MEIEVKFNTAGVQVKKDWENFLSSKDQIIDKDEKATENKIQKTFSFDLHGYSLNEANKKVEILINDSFQKLNFPKNYFLIRVGRTDERTNGSAPF